MMHGRDGIREGEAQMKSGFGWTEAAAIAEFGRGR
jgi:hypothetical protein